MICTSEGLINESEKFDQALKLAISIVVMGRQSNVLLASAIGSQGGGDPRFEQPSVDLLH
ncbi:hypothetical protein SDC9_149834 [bioreactor metagenome]|uniref:Uncharacterized protein n=1 Tax=bioreactor metagenome TaxID=1076179 RepID=A0A645EKT4_9ZZZZ